MERHGGTSRTPYRCCLLPNPSQVPLRVCSVLVVAQTAATFVLAYRVTPTIVALQQQHQEGVHAVDGPVPLQCGGGLRPEHSALLSCRPLAQQVLLGLAMVAWPVGLSWAMERRLRRQHAAMCREWERRRQSIDKATEQQQEPLACEQEPQPPGSSTSFSGVNLIHSDSAPFPAFIKAPLSNANGSTACPAQRNTAAAYASTHVGTKSVRLPTVPYQALTTMSFMSVKVRSQAAGQLGRHLATPRNTNFGFGRSSAPAFASGVLLAHGYSHSRLNHWLTSPLEHCMPFVCYPLPPHQVHDHPGTFEEYAGRLAAAAPQLLRRGLGAAPGEAAKAAGPGLTPPRLLPHGALLQSAVVRGCVQLIAWARELRQEYALGEGPSGDAPGGGTGLGSVGMDARQQLQALAGALPGLLLEAGCGGAERVSVQVGDGLAAAAKTVEEEAVAVSQEALHHAGCCAAVQLLLMWPFALPVGPDQADGEPRTVRLLLQSPRSQPARLLLLAERGGGRGGQQFQAQPPARLLCEVAVELVGGPQEVELALGVGELEGAVGADGVGVLQLVLVGPEHSARDAGDAAHPLVHFVAPPLLVLPPAAAAEVCGLWDAIRHEAGGGANEGAAASSGGYGGEQQSSLWWSHLAPLLGDLAYVLGAGGQQGQGQQADDEEAGCEAVLSQLLPYLHGSGMGTTARLLEAHAAKAAASRSTAPAVAEHTAAGGAKGLCPLLRMPLYPRRPPAQEAAYQEWRMGCLRATAPYVVTALSTIYLTALVRLLVGAAAGGASNDSSSIELPSLPRLMVLLVLNLGSDLVGYVVLLVADTRPARAVRRLWLLRRGSSGPVASQGPAVLPEAGGSSGAQHQRPAEAGTGDAGRWDAAGVAWAYSFAATVVSPLLFLTCAVGIRMRLLPIPGQVGDTRTVYGATIQRAVLMPAVQRLGVWQAAAAAPVLGLGEALQMRQLLPAWEGWQVVAMVAGWRLMAAAVSAFMEWRSRRLFARYMLGRAVGAEAVAGQKIKVRSGAGRGVAPFAGQGCKQKVA